MTTKVLKLLVITVSIAISAWAQSQSSCQALVQQGIYDTFSTSTDFSDYSQFISQICNSTSQGSNNQGKSASSATSSYQDSSDNTETTSEKVSVLGVSAHHKHTVTNDESSSAETSDNEQLSSSQIAALAQFMCSSANSQSGSAESLNQLSQVIDPNVISAYEECLAATSSGLQTSTTIRQDQCQVTIQVNYVPPVGANATTTIDSIEINPSGAWDCSGSLWDLVESNTTLDTNSVAMSCTRNVSETPFTFQNVLVFAEPSSIIISAASNVILRNFSSILAKNLPEDDISSVTQALKQLKGFLSDLSDAIQLENDAIQGNFSSFSASLQNFSAMLNDASSSLSDLSDEIAQQQDPILNLQDYTRLDISETCYNLTLAGTVLYATCNYTSEPGAMNSFWELTECVGVLNEQFICIPGVPSVSTANNLTIEGTILSGYLPTLATVDLSNFFTNRNGRLECECEMN